jgi:phenylalanyl-tRNA synthetase beta chain
MKISHNWLKNLIHLPEEPAVIAGWLTGLGLEVESLEEVEKIPGSLAGLVIAEVKECEKHPDADKLKVTKVDAGKEELLQVVCGAPNVAAGQKVVVALEGAVLHPSGGDSFQIKK